MAYDMTGGFFRVSKKWQRHFFDTLKTAFLNRKRLKNAYI